jgi:hypothetical protein
MKLSIAQVLKNANEFDTVEKRREYILSNDSPAIQAILKHCFDPNIKFSLPTGKAPYAPSQGDRLEGRLYSEVRKLYLFVEGGHPTLTKLKREQLFIDLLESIHPEDAELLVAIKDKKIPYKHITPNLVKKTYPGLIENT